MRERLACAAMLYLSLCACRQAPIDDPTLIAGGGPVSVLASSYVSNGDSQATLGAGAVTYVVCRIELTNDGSGPLYPVISHFYLSDRTGSRYYGIDAGSAVFAGISNDLSAIRPAAKRTFVVGFRAAATTMGTIRYDY
jgi:hypothetical protein